MSQGNLLNLGEYLANPHLRKRTHLSTAAPGPSMRAVVAIAQSTKNTKSPKKSGVGRMFRRLLPLFYFVLFVFFADKKQGRFSASHDHS